MKMQPKTSTSISRQAVLAFIVTILIAAPLSLLTSAAIAEATGSPQAQVANEVKLFDNSLGLGIGAYQLPFIGNHTAIRPEPMVALSWGPLFASEYGAGSFVWGSPKLAIGIGFTGDLLSTERNEVDELADMEELDPTFSASLLIITTSENQVGGVALSKEVTAGNGHNAIFRWEFRSDHGRWETVKKINVVWRDDESANYLYGVRPSEAKANRPAYSMDYSLRSSTGVDVAYNLDRNWQIVSGADLSLYDNNIDDSPIIERNYSFAGWLGLNYVFR